MLERAGSSRRSSLTIPILLFILVLTLSRSALYGPDNAEKGTFSPGGLRLMESHPCLLEHEWLPCKPGYCHHLSVVALGLSGMRSRLT